MKKQESHEHIIAYGSVVQKRVVNSTSKAETYQLSDVVAATVFFQERASQTHMDAWITRSGTVLPQVS